MADANARVTENAIEPIENLTDGLCPIPRFAKSVGVSEVTMYRWIKLGTVPVVRIGGKRYVVLAAARKALRPDLHAV